MCVAVTLPPANLPMMPALINGRYQVLQPLQAGGFGQTYLAEDIQMPSRRRCVIKQLKPVAHNPEFYQLIQERFQREAATLETLGEACRQIPRLYAYLQEGEHFYLVEEWVEGPTLTQKVAEVGRFSDQAVRQLLGQILTVIEQVHQRQIIHRDIKPDNIILRQSDQQPVLIDFGAVKETMATVVDVQGETGRSIVIGTPGYMPPEQSAGQPLFASDIYSLGLTAIFLLTAKRPMDLPTDPMTGQLTWRPHAPQVSNELAAILETATHVVPAHRYRTASQMQQALQTAIPHNMAEAPTVVSRPQAPGRTAAPVAASVAPSTLDTERVAPPDASQTTPPAIAKPAGSNLWLKSVLIGGLVGSAIIAAFAAFSVFRPQPTPVVQPSPLATTAPIAAPPVPTPDPVAEPSPEPPPTPQPTASPVSTPAPAAATCGDASGSGQRWYPVFINNGDVAQIRQQYCQDAIAKVREDGTPAVQVASFTAPDRAATFANEIGGEVGEPYDISQPPPAVPPTSPPTNAPNATIVGTPGEKNIRRGPGTAFGVQHIAFPGDRVQIRNSQTDSGGFLWYEIYFPESGASGWIAAQLLRPD